LKRQQRARQLEKLERAADNLDKLELKVQKSVQKEKKVNERKKGWEDVNEEKKAKKQGLNAFGALEEEDDGRIDKEREWVSDEEMPEAVADAEEHVTPDVSGEVKEVVVPATNPLPVAPIEEDEML
jgi:hypothetical protein